MKEYYCYCGKTIGKHDENEYKIIRCSNCGWDNEINKDKKLQLIGKHIELKIKPNLTFYGEVIDILEDSIMIQTREMIVDADFNDIVSVKIMQRS